jgi:hypothetical protein
VEFATINAATAPHCRHSFCDRLKPRPVSIEDNRIEGKDAALIRRIAVSDQPSRSESHFSRDLSFADLDAALRSGTSDKIAPDICKDARLELKKWLFEKRLEYARYFFDHHAKQRMQMFNFFLIFAGFIVAGYATILKEYAPISSALAVVGAGLTVLFIFLDRRNEELVHITEDVLGALESDVLFSGYERNVPWPRRRTWWGRMEARPQRRPLGIFLRQRADDEKLGEPSKYEHGRWIPRFQRCIFILFAALVILPWIVNTVK